jgi:uncharacterized protein YjgD (DUF1641 family)
VESVVERQTVAGHGRDDHGREVDVREGVMGQQNPQDLASLHEKIDALTKQVEFLTEQARVSVRRQREVKELLDDLTPVGMDLYRQTVQELDEIDSYVQLEDILAFVKRLMRNTRTFNEYLDRVEGLQELIVDLTPVSRDVFLQMIDLLDGMERKGYLRSARSLLALLDAVASSFSPEEIDAISEHIGGVIAAAKRMAKAYESAQREPGSLPGSTWGLVREMRDPQVRHGMALVLRLLKAFALETENQINKTKL